MRRNGSSKHKQFPQISEYKKRTTNNQKTHPQCKTIFSVENPEREKPRDRLGRLNHPLSINNGYNKSSLNHQTRGIQSFIKIKHTILEHNKEYEKINGENNQMVTNHCSSDFLLSDDLREIRNRSPPFRMKPRKSGTHCQNIKTIQRFKLRQTKFL